jgi:signal transduction histidine kinase
MFNSIKSRLLLIFILFGTTGIIAMLLSFYYIENKQQSILEMNDKIETVYKYILKDVKVTRDFFSNETISNDYFVTGKSENLNTHKKMCRQIKKTLSELANSKEAETFQLKSKYDTLISQFNTYVVKTDGIIKYINLRGYKDYKLEGRMRYYAHLLEGLTKEVGLANVLVLRKHEKDFIIRQDIAYMNKLHQQSSIIKKELNARCIDKNKKKEITDIINNYVSKFDSIVFYDKKIGLKNQEGLKQEIDNILNKIEITLDSALDDSVLKVEETLANLKFYLICFWIILVTIGVLLSILLANKISASIIHLKEKMTEFLESDFKMRTVLPIKESKYEIDVLTTNFSILEQHIMDQMRVLRDKNRELETFVNRASINLSESVSGLEDALVNTQNLAASEKHIILSQHVNEAVNNLNDSIEELKLISSIKKEKPNTEFIDPGDLIKRSIESLRSHNEIGNIVFRTKIEMHNQFYSDARLVKVILKNLISNSILSMNPTKRNPFIEIAVEEIENKMVKITITDNGIGIKKESLKFIFDIFYKANEKAEGSGLGLYIVQNALQQLKGATKVVSTENVGTTITVFIPNATRKTNSLQRIKENKNIFPKREEFILDYL